MSALDEPDLEMWLAKLARPGDDDGETVRSAFPNAKLEIEYLDSIATRSEQDVRALLRHFLVSSGTFEPYDQIQLKVLAELQKENRAGFEQLTAFEQNRRLILSLRPDAPPPWEGITWVLDLLPGHPLRAIEVIQSYVVAHAQSLPDICLAGLGDAQAVIRAMWIGNPRSAAEKLQTLLGLGSRSFEHVVESLYHAMGFTTDLTRPSGDGGRDVIASRDDPGRRERTLIECKLWTEPVGVGIVRQLLGVVANERPTKGTLVTTSRFTRGARDLAEDDPRLELIRQDQLLALLDQHLGADWARHVDAHVTRSRQRMDGRRGA